MVDLLPILEQEVMRDWIDVADYFGLPRGDADFSQRITSAG
jgi:hypothetical protein